MKKVNDAGFCDWSSSISTLSCTAKCSKQECCFYLRNLKPYPKDNHIYVHLLLLLCVFCETCTSRYLHNGVWLWIFGVFCSHRAQERICLTVICTICTSELYWEQCACELCAQSAYSWEAVSRAGNSSKTRLKQADEAFPLYIYS